MLQWWSAALRRDTRGFTLVELLIVIVIVALLSAIAVPIFLNQRSKAEDAATAQEVAQLAGVANGGVAGNWIAGVDPGLGLTPNATQGNVPADAATGFTDTNGVDFQAGLEGLQRVRVVSYSGSIVVDPEITRAFANVEEALFCVSKESPTGKIYGATSDEGQTGAEQLVGPVREMESHCIGSDQPCPNAEVPPFVDGTSAITMPDGWATPDKCPPPPPPPPPPPGCEDEAYAAANPDICGDCSDAVFAANNPGVCPGPGVTPNPTCSDASYAEANPAECGDEGPPEEDLCDRDELIKLISGAADPNGVDDSFTWRQGYERMFAWAKVHNLTGSGSPLPNNPLTNPAKDDWRELRITVGDFLNDLDGKLLRKPLIVTNHGYDPDRTPAWWSLTSTLTRGDVILVDDNGEPKARCACGNPLKTWKGTGTLQTEGDNHSLIGPAPDITRNADNTWTVSLGEYPSGYKAQWSVVASLCQPISAVRDGTVNYTGEAPPWTMSRRVTQTLFASSATWPSSGTAIVNDCTGENERLVVYSSEAAHGVESANTVFFNIYARNPQNISFVQPVREYSVPYVETVTGANEWDTNGSQILERGLIGPAPEISRNADGTWTVSIDDYTNGYGGVRDVRLYSCVDVDELRFFPSFDGSKVWELRSLLSNDNVSRLIFNNSPSVHNTLPGFGSVTLTECTGRHEQPVITVTEGAYGSIGRGITTLNITSATPSVLTDTQGYSRTPNTQTTSGVLQTSGDGLIGPAPEITRNADNTWTVSIEDYTNGYIGRGGSNARRVSAPFCQNTETARFYSSYDGSYVAPPDARSTGYSTIMGLPGQPYSGSVTVNDCTGENERLIVSVYEFPQGVAPQTLTWWNITSATPSVLRDPADIAEYNYGSF